MEFRILGPFEVWAGSSQIEIGGTKRSALLALLVLRANEVVGRDRLIDELWGECPPRTAAASLHNHVSRLRKVLGPERLGTRASGYVLRVQPDEVDLHRFERLVHDAEPLPAKKRSDMLAKALALWRGPALADLVFEPALNDEIARLDELRLAAVERRVDADLELGSNAAVVAELKGLIGAHPLREGFRSQLMLALYRDGRQAEALEVYRETRLLLADELGLEPSPALRELERAVLCQDPALAPTARVHDRLDVGSRRWAFGAAVALLLVGGGVAMAVAAATHRRSSGDSPSVALVAPRLATFPSLPRVTVPKVKPTPANHFTKPTAPRSSDEHARSSRPRPSRTALVTVRARAAPAYPSRLRTEHPIATRTKPATRTTAKRTKPAKVYWLADDFTNPAFSSRIWNLRGSGTGVDVAESNGQLQFSVAPVVTYDPSLNSVDQHYGTDCDLTGNFDAEIEFKLLEWPSDDGVLVSFGMYFPPPRKDFWSISRIGASGIRDSEGYLARFGGRDQWTSAAGTSGALRLRRVGGLVEGYYRNGRRWVQLDSAHYASGPVSLVLGLVAHPGEFGDQAATATIDNFDATATSVACPPGTPVPPRQPSRER